MSAEIESYIARKPGWHGLGTVLERGVTAEEAMTLGHLGDWNVRKTPLFSAVPVPQLGDDGELEMVTEEVAVPDYWNVTRDNPFTRKPESLGVVGNQWQAIQNEALADMLSAIADASGGFIETAGSLKGGRMVFFSMALDSTFRVGGVDPIDMYLMLVNSHDRRGGSFRGAVTPIRPVCANTVRAGLNSAKSSFSFRHVGDPTKRVQEAREALELTWDYAEKFQQEAERMIQTDMMPGQFADAALKLFPAPDKDAPSRTLNAFRERVYDLSYLFEEAPTQANIRNTRWAGFQALVEYADYFAPVSAKPTRKATARAERVMSGEMDDFKSKAFELTRVPA